MQVKVLKCWERWELKTHRSRFKNLGKMKSFPLFQGYKIVYTEKSKSILYYSWRTSGSKHPENVIHAGGVKVT